MLSTAKASIRLSIWRYLHDVMQRPEDEWDTETGRRHLLELRNSTRSALLVLTKHSNHEWVGRVY